MPAEKRAFYRYHASLMEPWDGPASIAFTDGTVIGAVLDRNGLRPSRYWVTDDDRVIMASEAGVRRRRPRARRAEGPAAAGAHVPRRHRQGPHRRRRGDQGTSSRREQPYGEWLERGPRAPRTTCPTASTSCPATSRCCGARRRSATRTRSSSCSSRRWRAPAARRSARWAPTRRSRCCPTGPRMLFDYFQQLFAQVTNPPLDAIREELVTSLSSHDRRRGQPARARARVVPCRSSCRSRSSTTTSWPSSSTSTTTATGPSSRRARDLGSLPGGRRRRARCARRSTACAPRRRPRSPRASASSCSPTATPTPSGRRSRRCCSPRRCTTTSSARRPARRSASSSRRATPARCTTWRCSLGYGAGAINPYLAFESIEDLIAAELHGLGGIDPKQAIKNYIKAAGKGVLKVMSKMGISTVASYRGAQVFEAIGLGQELVDEYFTGTVSRLGGIGLDEIAEEVRAAPRASRTPSDPTSARTATSTSAASTSGGARASTTSSTPRRCSSSSTRPAPSATTSTRSTRRSSTTSRRKLATLRGLFELREGVRPPVPIDEVEPVARDREALRHRRDVVRLDLARRRTRTSRSR